MSKDNRSNVVAAYNILVSLGHTHEDTLSFLFQKGLGSQKEPTSNKKYQKSNIGRSYIPACDRIHNVMSNHNKTTSRPITFNEIKYKLNNTSSYGGRAHKVEDSTIRQSLSKYKNIMWKSVGRGLYEAF